MRREGNDEVIERSVRRRPLDAVDHHDVHRTALSVELQSQLITQRGEQRWSVGYCSGRSAASTAIAPLFGRPPEDEIVES